jgi:putative addiction module component (TIGR02574 family)
MATAFPLPPPGFDELSPQEKLDYVQSLWDRILAKPEEILVPGWHLQLLGERLADYEADPEAGTSWEEVREDLSRKLHEHARLLQSWIVDGDAQEQRQTGEYLVQALDEDRLSDRRLFPPELKGVTW